MTEPVPFEYTHLTSDYTLTEIEHTPSFTMAQTNKSKFYVPVSVKESDSDHENTKDDDAKQDPLDVIAVKQFHQSKMDFVNQVYVGSLTILGLYIVYKYLRR